MPPKKGKAKPPPKKGKGKKGKGPSEEELEEERRKAEEVRRKPSDDDRHFSPWIYIHITPPTPTLKLSKNLTGAPRPGEEVPRRDD